MEQKTLGQKTLGKYELRRELGRGAAGIVYEGWDPDLARAVAIKTVRLPPVEDEEAEEQLARFRQEAQAAAQLSHPNIVQVYDRGRVDDLAFIVMEFVEGGSLKQLLGPGQALPPAEAIRVIREVLSGLAASHARGIVHRDIKPENIMLRDGQVKIADFGIARMSSSRLTQDGTVMGTPLYMSPEQCRGETVDMRTDLWSTGVMLYQALTGRRPFEGSGFAAIMNKVLNTEPPPPSELCPPGLVPPALDRAVMKALDKRLTQDGRFATAQAFSQALEGALAGSGPLAGADEGTQVIRPGDREPEGTRVILPTQRPAATAVPAPPPAPPPVRVPAPEPRRSVLPWVGAAAVLLLLAGGGGGWWWLHQPPSDTVDSTTGGATTGGATTTGPAGTGSTDTGPATTGSTATGPTATGPATTEPTTTGPAGPTVASVNITPVVPPAPPPPSLSDLRAQLAAADCTLVNGSLEANNVLLYGIAAADRLSPIMETYRSLHDAAPPGGSYQFAVQQFARVPAYCTALDIIRPFASPIGSTHRGLVLQMDTRGVVLRDKSPYSLAVTMPDFPGLLQIDYFSGADVEHLGLWLPPQPGKPVSLATALRLGAGERTVVYQNVATDPGTDMVIAIAARERLFAQPRPQTEPAAPYLEALRDVLRTRLPTGVAAHAIRVVIER